jgi:hydrogenase maturation protease
MTKGVLVLGLGNLLRRDEGLGVVSIQRLLERYELPEGVEVVDGGTLGLDLLVYLEEAGKVLVLDAALTGGPPGVIVRYANEEVPAFLGLRTSPHEIALADLLAVAKLRETAPGEVVVLGMQPEELELGLGLSEAIEANLDRLVQMAVEELQGWGFQLTGKEISQECTK